MSKHIDVMAELIQTKKDNKKKEPNASEREQFLDAWKGLVAESGFSREAEDYLYNGFSFCGAEPFFWYLNQKEDKNATLRQLFSGRLYGKDSNVTFRLLSHLFALLLNDEAEGKIIAPIIKHFPSACVNKEGKKLGTAGKTIEKYFFNVLSPSAELPPLSGVNLNPAMIGSFVSCLSDLIDDLKKESSIKEPVISNITKVSDWINAYRNPANASTATPDNRPEKINTEHPNGANNDKAVTGHISNGFQPVVHTQSHTESLPDILKRARDLADKMEREREQQKNHIMSLERQLTEREQKLAHTNEKIQALEINVKDLSGKNWDLERRCATLQQTINEKDAQLEEKDREIQERIKMSDALSRDRTRQADESLQRIASKIRIEYRDFMDALDAEMTADLGENMRLQLLSIFEILEKGGMKLQ